MRNILYLLIISLLLFNSCNSVKKIKVGDPRNLKVEKFSLKQTQLGLDVPVENPNFFAITIKEMDLVLAVDEFEFIQLNNTGEVRISRKSKEMVHVSFRVKPSQSVMQLFMALKSFLDNKVELRLTGTVKASGMLLTKTVPVDETRTLTLVR